MGQREDKSKNLMENSSKSKSINWIIALVSLVVVVFLVIVKPEWFWVALPFFLTYFVIALDMI
jgi:hypothetical protein